MKIIIANPNSTQGVTDMAMESARKYINESRVELIPFTNTKGSRHVDCVFGDYQSTGPFALAMLEVVDSQKPDAVVIAGFGNFGIFALKEALSIPTLSICETSQVVASMLGHKYSILTVQKQNIPYQEDMVRLFRLENKCASVRGVNVDVEKCVTDRALTLKLLRDELLKIAEEDGCEVIVLGGARFCCYAEELQEMVGMPIIDPIAVTVKMAQMMVETHLCHSKKRKFAHPLQELSDYFPQ